MSVFSDDPAVAALIAYVQVLCDMKFPAPPGRPYWQALCSALAEQRARRSWLTRPCRPSTPRSHKCSRDWVSPISASGLENALQTIHHDLWWSGAGLGDAPSELDRLRLRRTRGG